MPPSGTTTIRRSACTSCLTWEGSAITHSGRMTLSSSCSTAPIWIRRNSPGWRSSCGTPIRPGKSATFHHPLYSDGKFHGPDLDLRSVLTPLFQKYGVNVVFSGHEHVYERLKPQNGIYYFVLGNSGQLRYHNLRHSDEMQVGFDADRDFMVVEIDGDELYFQTISGNGLTIDSGSLRRQSKNAAR